MGWEYALEQYQLGPQEHPGGHLSDLFTNTRGKQGWELAAITPMRTDDRGFTTLMVAWKKPK